MSSSIGDKTPAQSYKDLLHLNNDNGGLLSDLSTVYSGNGIATPLRLAAEKIEADFSEIEAYAAKLETDIAKVSVHERILG